MGIGIQGGIGQKQAQIQIEHIGSATKEHAEHILQNYAGEIKQVEPQCAPEILDALPQGIVAEKADDSKQGVTGIVGQHITDQPPYLSLQDQLPIKAEDVIQRIVLVDHAENVDKGITQHDIKHQIGDAFFMVLKAETLKTGA